MKIRIVTILFIASASVCFAQTAKVIQISDKEAVEAKSLFAQQKEIEAKLDALRQRITREYLTASKEEEGHTNTYRDPRGAGWVWVKSGWGSGEFDFSEDFKFIVPKAVMPFNSYSGLINSPICYSALTGSSGTAISTNTTGGNP